jgi:hypothetical protein
MARFKAEIWKQNLLIGMAFFLFGL